MLPGLTAAADLCYNCIYVIGIYFIGIYAIGNMTCGIYSRRRHVLVTGTYLLSYC